MTYVFAKDGQRGRRAVSVVIGVMLMMSILFLAAAQYQLVVVPQQEETTEVDHYRTVSNQMSELRTDILTASSLDASSSQKITMGAQYSRDLIFGIIPEIHQTDPAGRIHNDDFAGQIEVRNVEGLGSASNYWPGVGDPCAEPNHCFDTTSFHYEIGYNQFEKSPEIIYENTILYDRYENDPSTTADDEYVIHADQNLVQGRSINLVSLTGNLEQSRISPATIEAVPVSAPAQSISIQSNGSDPVTFIVPTRLPVDEWRNNILDDQINGPSNPDGYINAVRAGPDPDTIEIEMLPGETYNMKLSRVHLTSREEASTVPIEKAAYVAWKGNERVTIRENATTEITAQVRDRYNNPVPGVDTQAHARDSSGNCIGDFRSATGSCPGGQQQPGVATSGEDGSLAYFFEAPDVDSDTTITINIELNDPSMTYTPRLDEPVVPMEELSATEDENDLSLLSASPKMGAASSPPTASGAAPRLGGMDFPIRPEIRAGYLNPPDNTVRVIDFSLANTSTSFGQTVRATVLVDNTGWQSETITLQPQSTMSIATTPNEYELTLAPGERKRVGFDIQFQEAGTHTLTVNGVAGYSYDVQEARNDVIPGTIRNRIDKEDIQKSPSVFKDGDSLGNEYQESNNIPPIEYDSSTGTYLDTAVGNLYQFTYIGAEDDNTTVLDAIDTGAPRDSLNVGFSTGYVPDNDVYTLFVNYSFEGGTQYVRLTNVNTTGEKVDSASEYYLSTAGSGVETQRAFQLTPEEAEDLQRSNEFLATINEPQGDHPEMHIDWMWLTSSESIPRLTDSNIAVEPSSITASPGTVVPGETITLTIDLTNDKNSVGKKRLKLYEDDGDGNWDAVKSLDTWVNPGDTKTITVLLHKSNPGTYDYRFGTENTPDSDAVTVTVTHG